MAVLAALERADGNGSHTSWACALNGSETEIRQRYCDFDVLSLNFGACHAGLKVPWMLPWTALWTDLVMVTSVRQERGCTWVEHRSLPRK
jgi:hypothetical protein